jgi:excisionase family DNA binding protein
VSALADALDAQADSLDAQARTLRAIAAAERRRADAGAMFTVKGAAKKIGRSTRYLRDQISEGRLRAVGRGRVIMIAASDLDAWIAAQPARPVKREIDTTDNAGVCVEVTEGDVDRAIDAMMGHA